MKEITFALAKSSKLLWVKPRAVLWCQTRLRQALLLANPFSQPPQYEIVNPKSQIKNIQIEHTLHWFTSAYIHGHIPTRIAIPKPTVKRTHARKRLQEEKRVWERERERKGGFDLWWLTERFEVAVVAIGSRRWRWRRWGVVFRVIESEGLFESLVLRLESDRSEFGGESELRVFSI